MSFVLQMLMSVSQKASVGLELATTPWATTLAFVPLTTCKSMVEITAWVSSLLSCITHQSFIGSKQDSSVSTDTWGGAQGGRQALGKPMGSIGPIKGWL